MLDSGRAGAQAVPRHPARDDRRVSSRCSTCRSSTAAGWDTAADDGRGAGRRAERRDEPARRSAARTASAACCRVGGHEIPRDRRAEAWAPSPKFYDLNNGSFDERRGRLRAVPLGPDARIRPVYGNTNCWKNERDRIVRQDFLNSECVWLQMWAELPTRAGRATTSRRTSTTTRASRRRSAACRGQLNNQLYDVDQWLDFNKVVQKDNRVLIGIAMLFLGVCLVNVVGLLLAEVPERRGDDRPAPRARREPARHRAPAPRRSAADRRWPAACSGSCWRRSAWPVSARCTTSTSRVERTSG